jgi:hypothetical protein
MNKFIKILTLINYKLNNKLREKKTKLIQVINFQMKNHRLLYLVITLKKNLHWNHIIFIMIQVEAYKIMMNLIKYILKIKIYKINKCIKVMDSY